MFRLRSFLHRRLGVHFWAPHVGGGVLDKRRCRICGRIEWLDYIRSEWFCPEEKVSE